MPVSLSKSKVYFLWETKMHLLDLAISMPKTYLKGPRSFILNSLARTFLRFSIFITLLPVKMISSTYTMTIITLPSVKCLKNIVWSTWLCKYPKLRTDLVNLSNQAQEIVLSRKVISWPCTLFQYHIHSQNLVVDPYMPHL